MNKVNRYLFCFLMFLINFSCSSTINMQVLVKKPANFVIPKDIKKITLINKSKGNAWSVIDGILTGEMPHQDKHQSESCINGMQQILFNNSTINFSRHPMRLDAERGSSTGFGNPMSWSMADSLAEIYSADALLVLEYFDTDFSVRDITDYSKNSEIYIRGTAKARAGFRFYDIKARAVIYEKNYSFFQTYSQHAVTKAEAIARLIRGSDALEDVSYSTGRKFAQQLVIHNTWENRWLCKGNDENNKGCRFAVAGDWKKAIDIWLQAYQNTDSEKEKGKISYNLGLGYEVEGALNDAKKWITVSYAEHNFKKAAAYATIINKRIESEQLLDEQLKATSKL